MTFNSDNMYLTSRVQIPEIFSDNTPGFSLDEQ